MYRVSEFIQCPKVTYPVVGKPNNGLQLSDVPSSSVPVKRYLLYFPVDVWLTLSDASLGEDLPLAAPAKVPFVLPSL